MTRLGAKFWAWVPAGLLGGLLSGLFTMAMIASSDPGFALERDYYKKAVTYDREIAQRAENERLGWDVRASTTPIGADGVATVLVSVRDASGPIVGARARVEALRNATADQVLEAALSERAAGDYGAELRMNRGGLWELRLTMERGTDRFTTSVRTDVGKLDQ